MVVMAEACPICEGSGLRVVQRPDATQYAEDCICRVERRMARSLDRARIPRRYEHCILESFEPGFNGGNPSLEFALIKARGFIEAYPFSNEGRGLLITGSVGVGKTHLATGVLRELVAKRGAKGLFCDYRDLLKQVQNSYNRQVQETELDVLRPLFEAEVLVLDELGAAKPSEWVWDTVAHILNTRYNDQRTTIITTNYANLPPLAVGKAALDEARMAARDQTLGDRIGERMRSRLQEMCVVIEMEGADFRQGVKRAKFE